MSTIEQNDATLTLEEFAILSVTNSFYLDEELKNHMDVVFTSRETYFWVPVLCHLIQATELKVDEIKVFIELSLTSLATKNSSRWNNRALGVEGMLSILESVLFYSTRLKFNSQVLEHQSLLGSYIDHALERLEKHNLIADQHIEMLNGTPGVMMGLLPLGFTKRTQVGEEMFLKYCSIFRRMEIQKEIKGSPYEQHYRFNLVWEIFKTSIFTMEAIYGSTKTKNRAKA